MECLPVPATKSTAIRLKEELSLARGGMELLDQKKDILVNQINLLAGKADRVRIKAEQQLLSAYGLLKQAMVELGRDRVEAAGLAIALDIKVHIRERSLMGVVLPLVEISMPRLRPEYSLADTNQSLDQVRRVILSSLEVIAELAEVETGLERLMRETKRTLKRINALSYIYIPLYETTLKSIESKLEEKERERLFQLKRVRGQA